MARHGHLFSQIPRAEIQRSSFDRSHGYKTAFNSGYLIPFFVDEVLPGDTFKLKATIFGRLSTPIVPIMDNLYIETFFFFVPNRLVWDHWQAFNGEQKNPNDSTDYLVPTVKFAAATDNAVGTIYDYLGLPTGVANYTVNALPLRAYNLIYNEWFRDENLQDSLDVPTGDGPDQPSLYKLVRRGKRHDYFTSCLPWPQKGPGVELPLSGNANVVLPKNMQISQALTTHTGTVQVTGSSFYIQNIAGSWVHPVMTVNDVAKSGMYADLSSVSAITINSLRQAFQLQKLYEKDARGGTRYTEILRAHFGVVSPDARLQRPEFLGGSSGLINIHPVEQTSATDTTSPQGNLAAFGVITNNVHGFTKSFVEHGIILGLINVRATLSYQQGLNRMWSRQTRFDYYWPVLAHLGEQAVLNKEIYTQGTDDDEGVFGYQERWAEYRYYPSMITGKLRSTDAQTLDYWHLSQKFASLPKLNAEFIQDNPPLERALAVPSEPQIIMDCWFNMSCVRPMPVYSVPGLVDHF